MHHNQTKTKIVFTDLDGTLLDENYSCREALPALEKLRKKNIPVILCSSKTRAEQEVYNRELGIRHPFIVENGSAIFIPKNYFKSQPGNSRGDYDVVVLGVDSGEILKKIEKLKEKYEIKNYNSMSEKEVSQLTGLSLEAARHAKMRDFSETMVEAEKGAVEELRVNFNAVCGGRFITVFGKNADKGRAVEMLAEFYRKFSDNNIQTIGIGNSYNDEPMLKAVDVPALVKNPDGKWAEIDIKNKNIYRAQEVGPAGWCEVVERFVLG